MLKEIQIAIFDQVDLMLDVPEGCPVEYVKSDFASRHAFAEWLEQKGSEFIWEGEEKISPYKYYMYERGNTRKYRFAVAIVPVDISRPWFIHWSNGREKIWYLDKRDEHNMVIPEIKPEVVSYGLAGDSCVIR